MEILRLTAKSGRGRPGKERADPFIDHPELKTDPVFLIGNGTSRSHFDLERLRPYGTIIGCNGLYRDFSPDILVCIDAKLITEVREAKYSEDNLVILPANRSNGMPHALLYRTDKFNTSGAFALKMIGLTMKPKRCFMLGMDGYPGNVYDKTKNYAENTLQNFSGVLSYYDKVITLEDITTTYINVNHKDTWNKELKKTGKYKHITYDVFEDYLQNGTVVELADT